MPGTSITLGAAQELKALNIELIPQAIVIGKVVDEDSEPLSKVQIQVLRRDYMRRKSQLLPAGGGSTLDNGEFRVADLPPGRYFLSAIYRGRNMMFGDGPARNTDGKPEEDYVTTYYPGSVDQNAAQAIDLEAGQELTGLNIRMQKAKIYRVKGTVTGFAPPIRNTRLMLTPRGHNVFTGSLMNMGTMPKEDGTFEIAGVQPGSYYVLALPMQGQSTSGKVPIDVGDRNLENVVLSLGTAVPLNGSIRVEKDADQPQQQDEKPISLAGVRVQLIVVDGVTFNTPMGLVKQDGSFTLENVGPDKYKIAVNGLPQDTWLKSIRTDDQDVLESGVDLTAGAPVSVQITLGTGTGQVSGTVQDSKQHPAAGSFVTLVPDPMREDRNDLLRVATTDQNGSFSLRGIAPGSYKVFAWEDQQGGRVQDPEFLKPHEGKAQKISVKVNSQQQVTLTQVDAEATAAAR